jgi:hypothetical protein
MIVVHDLCHLAKSHKKVESTMRSDQTVPLIGLAACKNIKTIPCASFQCRTELVQN